MKSTGVFLLSAFGSFALFYLMGSFIENSFNLSYWTEGCRWVIGGFGGLVSLFFGGFSADAYQDNHKV